MAIGTVTVGVASAQFLAANPLRSALLLQNLSANDVYINFGAPAVLGSGLRLTANQTAPTVLTVEQIGDPLRGSINAIAAAAGSKVFGSDSSVV